MVDVFLCLHNSVSVHSSVHNSVTSVFTEENYVCSLTVKAYPSFSPIGSKMLFLLITDFMIFCC